MASSETANALRMHFREHNGSVLAGSGMAFLFALIGWAVLYGVSFWLTMFALSVLRFGEGNVSSRFTDVFLLVACVLVAAARIHQWFVPVERTPDVRPRLEQAADVVLFVPRFTLSAWQTLSALVSLSDEELRQAAVLVDGLREQGKIPVQQLASLLPDARSRTRIVEALIVSRLADQITGPDLTWLYMSSNAPEAFRVRNRKALEAKDELEQMRRATGRQEPGAKGKTPRLM